MTKRIYTAFQGVVRRHAPSHPYVHVNIWGDERWSEWTPLMDLHLTIAAESLTTSPEVLANALKERAGSLFKGILAPSEGETEAHITVTVSLATDHVYGFGIPVSGRARSSAA